MICKKCNHDNMDDMRFCTNCGAKLSDANGHGRPTGRYLPVISAVLKYACWVFAVLAVLFLYDRNHYTVTEPEFKWEDCGGHCAVLDVHVKGSLPEIGVTAYDIKSFNVKPPCKNKFFVHQPMNSESIDKFVKATIDLYQIRCNVQICLWFGLAVICYCINRFYLKRTRKLATNNNTTATTIQ